MKFDRSVPQPLVTTFDPNCDNEPDNDTKPPKYRQYLPAEVVLEYLKIGKDRSSVLVVYL
jgi:hypothetical protein